MLLEEYLYDVFGLEVTLSAVDFKVPVFLRNAFIFKKIYINDVVFILAIVQETQRDLRQIKKQYRLLSQKTSKEMILVFEKLSAVQRKSLIKDKISFIAYNQQIYLPCLGMAISNHHEIENYKMTYSVQCVALHLFYHDWEQTNASKIAKHLSLPLITVARAVQFLISQNLVNQKGIGTRRLIVRKYGEIEYLKKLNPYLINPIKKLLYSKGFVGLKSGIYALSEKTILAANDNDMTYAVDTVGANKINIISKEEFLAIGGIKIEVWGYNPNILASAGIVDDISLILSLQDQKDERVLSAIAELKGKYQW